MAWKPSYRLVPSRFPPVSVYDRVADPADLEAVFAVENLTNPRLRQEAGDISLVPVEERVTGPGTTPVMAAFTHLDPEGSRFTDGTYGVYYAARSLATAIAETRYSRARFLSRTREEPIEVDMRTYQADVKGELHDIRNRTDLADVYDAEHYAAGQALGRALKAIQSSGIAYDSVRHKGGTCVGVFRPRILSNCIQGPHFCYVWDGSRITTVYEKKLYSA
ncbi:MAG TPA: RES family NAD+ phosphorylase [Burkholderiales bacterium]|nr:RES family NAD+ phosphorylase [Burkholderiales bacterium]